MGKHRKWFWMSGLYGNKQDILLNSMILSGIYCVSMSVHCAPTIMHQLTHV
jgi:hypothetical protein